MITVHAFKSISLLCPCVSAFLCLIIAITVCTKGTIGVDKQAEVIQELPRESDLEVYLQPLERLIDFCIKHKLYVDLNLEFGLFLVNVNLKNTLKAKQQTLPAKTRHRLEQLLLKNDVLGDYFRFMVKKTGEKDELEEDKSIFKLFYDENIWPQYLQTFSLDLLKQTKLYSPEQLEKIYGKWDTYADNIYNFDKYKPSPKESDTCLSFLAENPVLPLNTKDPGNCKSPNICKKGVLSGSDFGYGLTHRLLFLVVSRFARGCTVFSLKEDNLKMDKYCTRCFNEAQYIAANGYKLADLMMGQISLCSLLGHAQFFQRTWLLKLLEHENSEGCFGLDTIYTSKDNNKMEEFKDDEWSISRDTKLMMRGACDGHMTAIGAAMLSSALRYIIETYY